ncbi:hypothetical protein HLI17_34485 [Rhizobium laguerreae]|uniref:Uncharacterized protein n=1 Tax=Rhizobium laguerreae TaxID=1076926 RepID=A0A7Y2W9G0_9HYPH|nr:hypothetical protein [Rhizobium laguerreae]
MLCLVGEVAEVDQPAGFAHEIEQIASASSVRRQGRSDAPAPATYCLFCASIIVEARATFARDLVSRSGEMIKEAMCDSF